MQMIIDHHMFNSANPITANVQTITQVSLLRKRFSIMAKLSTKGKVDKREILIENIKS